MLRIQMGLFLLSALGFAAAAEDSATVLARAKTASGAARWDGIRSWHGDGTITSGGLSGEYQVTVDMTGVRSVDSYRLGSVDGAEGFDGTRAWERDPGGAVATLDSPDAVRRARSQAWVDARAYLGAPRDSATFSAAESRRLDGRDYRVIVATPRDGDPLTLWFAADDGLLARTQQRHGQDTATTTLDDYRDVDGVRVPFHSITDMTDAAGRTDPKRRVEIRFEYVALNAPVTDADFAAPPMRDAARVVDEGGVTRIPFQLVNNHIFVDARIDGKPARLIVDTAGYNMLTPAAARRLGVAAQGQLSAAGNGENRTELALGRAHELRVGGAVLDEPVLYVFDLGRLSDVEGEDVDGLVGYEMFRRFGVVIDYAAGELVVSEPARFTPPAGATAIAFTMSDSVPIVDADLDGLPARISIDTGSRTSLTLHAPYVHANGLVAKYAAAPEAVTGWGVGGGVRCRPARFGTLTIGGVAIRGIAGELFTGDKGSFANPDLSANLGGGVLRRFTVAFDYAASRMYLLANSAAPSTDAFDRSGLWLLRDGDALAVADVAADSAAAAAGLRSGDRIVSLRGEAVATRSLAQWRALLRDSPAGSAVAVAYLRGDAERMAQLTLADRIPPQRR